MYWKVPSTDIIHYEKVDCTGSNNPPYHQNLFIANAETLST